MIGVQVIEQECERFLRRRARLRQRLKHIGVARCQEIALRRQLRRVGRVDLDPLFGRQRL
jgi:hypothetical protein